MRLALVGADGADVGRMVDVVLSAASREEAPRVHGFVVAVQRRRVFVGAGRIGELDSAGARLRRGAINLREFELRAGESLAVRELLGRRVRDRRLVDVGIRSLPASSSGWEVATVALASGGLLARRRRAPEVVDWREAAEAFGEERPVVRQAAAIERLHPAEMAVAIRELPLARRRLLAAALEDERLADLLEELSEDDQLRIVEGLDRERVARVLDEMEADDAADLLGEFPAGRRAQLLAAMSPDEAEPVRRLLSYDAATAGGLMTPEPVIVSPDATVAEALARVRDPDLAPALAAQVFVTQAPNETPTGRYMGLAGYQRLLREAPAKAVSRCLDEELEPLAPEASDRQVAARLAAYDVVAVPVVDDAGRLLGAVTVDDVLDHLLPADWRDASQEA